MENSENFGDKLARYLAKIQFFSEAEAWDYFRIAAFGEAIGWTTLIAGIGISRYLMHGDRAAIDIAGQIHGTIFLVYIVSVFVFCASLRWTRKQTVIAALASIPPYGTLVFEKYMAHRRRDKAAKNHRQVIVRGIIMNKAGKVLALQLSDSGNYSLPGGAIRANESSEQALKRIIQAQTGIIPVIQRVLYIQQYQKRGLERLEFFFQIENDQDFLSVTLDRANPTQKGIDELEFISLKSTPYFEPSFLQTEPLQQILSQKNRDVVFVE